MASTAVLPSQPRGLEDPLDHLPCSRIVEYVKGQIIYDEHRPSTNLHLVMQGKVKVSRLADDGQQVVIDIYQADEFFGESAFLDLRQYREQATALDYTKVMMWTTVALQDIVVRRPKLGLALTQVLVQRTISFTKRIESFSRYNIECRLARSLIRFSERLGTLETDGAVRMMPLTHELLAEYIGTSREIVTHHMNQFRRQKLIAYSRKGIVLHGDGLRLWLERETGSSK